LGCGNGIGTKLLMVIRCIVLLDIKPVCEIGDSPLWLSYSTNMHNS